jgi:hypothetical protein
LAGRLGGQKARKLAKIRAFKPFSFPAFKPVASILKNEWLKSDY